MTSKHYTNDRQKREQVINTIGIGKVVARFVVDRGHKDGAERHEITDTGIIIICNNKTNKIITKLIARPGQIRRYYKDGKAPKNLIEKAIDNTVKNHYNYIQKERKRKCIKLLIRMEKTTTKEKKKFLKLILKLLAFKLFHGMNINVLNSKQRK